MDQEKRGRILSGFVFDSVLGFCFFINLVESRSVKVGGLYVVAVPVGQDHCWMIPCS